MLLLQTLDKREKSYNMADYKPTGSLDDLLPGTFYVEDVDSKYRKKYNSKS